MKLKFGLVGVGYWNHHFRLLTEHPDVELNMVCDRDSDALLRLRLPEGHKPIYCTPNLSDLLESDLDCVVVSTPVTTHYEIVKKLLQSGKHVLVEKAYTDAFDKCAMLNAYSNERKLKLSVGHTYIHNTCVSYIKELLDKKELGDVYYVSMTRVGMSPVRQDVNAAWDLGAHDFSMLIHWFGMPKNISSYGKSYLNDGVEDVVFSNLEFENNIMAHVKNSWLNPTKNRTVTIVGSKKMIVFDDIEKSVEIYDSKGKLENIHDLDNDPLRQQLNDFISSISLDVKPLVTGTDGLNVVRVLEAATQSMKNNSEKVFL